MTGQQVKEKIFQAGFSLNEVARALSITPQTLQKRLAVDDIKVGVLEEIAIATGKNVYFFLESGATVTVQQQANGKRATSNNQQGAFGNSQFGISLERQLQECQQRLQERDQIIVDLRKTISLYEQLKTTQQAR